MSDNSALDHLVKELEGALKLYTDVSAVDGRAETARACMNYLMACGVPTRLLAPLVELGGLNEQEIKRRKGSLNKGNTKPMYDSNRMVAGAAAISMLWQHARNGRALKTIAGAVAKKLGEDVDSLIQYRRDVTTRKKAESDNYSSYINDHYKKLKDRSSSSEHFESLVLAFLDGFLVRGKKSDQD